MGRRHSHSDENKIIKNQTWLDIVYHVIQTHHHCKAQVSKAPRPRKHSDSNRSSSQNLTPALALRIKERLFSDADGTNPVSFPLPRDILGISVERRAIIPDRDIIHVLPLEAHLVCISICSTTPQLTSPVPFSTLAETGLREDREHTCKS